MIDLKKIRIRPKLLLLFTFTGILPLLVVGSFYSTLSTGALIDKSFNQLITGRMRLPIPLVAAMVPM